MKLALLALVLVTACTVGESQLPTADAHPRPDAPLSAVDALLAPVDAPEVLPIDIDAPGPDVAMDWGSCAVNGVPGICEATSVCAGEPANTPVAGHCPGPTDIQCCVPRAATDAGPRPDSAGNGVCPIDMAAVGDACMDLYEAPNHVGAAPLVMYTFVESTAWCAARGKRLCYDDEWTSACQGPSAWPEPYGPVRVPGECNDDQVWRVYSQSKLDGWPSGVSTPDIESMDELFAAADKSTAGATAASHVASLYQAVASGADSQCVGAAGVWDLVGNVEEWTRRRDGGTTDFHGSLKGRYWAEARTCQGGVTTHGDGFRFYEIGFRCCLDR